MRILPLAMVGLAVLATGCASREAQRSAAPAPAPAPAMAPSGSMAGTTTLGMRQPDSIDRWAAAYEAEQMQRRR